MRTNDAILNVTQQDCANWLSHCEAYYPACSREEPIYVDVPNNGRFLRDNNLILVLADEQDGELPEHMLEE